MTTAADTTTGAGTTTAVGSTSTTATPATGTSSGSSSGGATCRKSVVLMGYWPPTNEMLRRFSDNPLQNPGAWEGEDWEGYGYDVYAFFPEFPPDGDPSNDPIGSPGAVGSPEFDLRVDYQATSADFWRIVDEVRPNILLTTSRGGSIDWELEALEGGHDGGDPTNPALDWSSDGSGADIRPTMDTVEPRSWDAISTWRAGNTLPSQLPIDAIFDATTALGIADVQIDTDGTSGNFLSGFLGLHGLYYQSITPHSVAAGHIHVGFGLPTPTAETLLHTTLHTVLAQFPADAAACPR
jgi:hypothetical protein